jgi:hypothetical protein
MLAVACAAPAGAQNLFEVQVFPDEVLNRGETEIEFHNVMMPGGTPLAGGAVTSSGHVHLSLEVTHGWTRNFETGFFIETSPATGDDHASLTGWHFRPKFRLSESQGFPLHVSVSLEYAFLKLPDDTAFRQAVAITPIFEAHTKSLDVSMNPGFDLSIKGPGSASAPVFEPSAKVAARLRSAVSIGLEYYAETGTIKRFAPVSQQHHIVFPVVDVRGGAGWDLNVGVGRGLTGGSEQWVFKTILGMRLRQ